MAVNDAPTTHGVKRRQSGSSPPAKKSKSAGVCDKAGPTVAPVSSTDGNDGLIVTGAHPPVLMTTIATPLPDNDWREMVLSVITEHSGEPDRLVTEPEIAPHMLDKSTPNGSCLFNALSKELTGTKRNHYALRQAICNFMLEPINEPHFSAHCAMPVEEYITERDLRNSTHTVQCLLRNT